MFCDSVVWFRDSVSVVVVVVVAFRDSLSAVECAESAILWLEVAKSNLFFLIIEGSCPVLLLYNKKTLS